MKTVFRGKYERKIYRIFFVVFTLLILIFMAMFSKSVYEQEAREREAGLIQTIQSNRNNSQLKLEIILNELERVVESESASLYATSDTENLQYFNAIKLQKELQIAVSRVNNIGFKISVIPLEGAKFILTPISSERFSDFFSTTLPMDDNVKTRFFENFKNGDRDYVLTVGEDNPKIVYTIRRRIEGRDLLFLLSIDRDEFITPSDDYRWYLCNDQGIFAWSNGDSEFHEGIYESFSENLGVDHYLYEQKKMFVQPYANMDWTLLVEYEDQSDDWHFVVTRMFMPIVILLLLALAGAWFFTRVLYRPVRDLMKEVDSTEETMKYDEFKVLKNSTGRITDLNRQLKGAMEERDVLMAQKLNRDLLFGVKSSIHYLETQKGNDSEYLVALIEFSAEEYDEAREFHLYKNDVAEFVQSVESISYANLSASMCGLILEYDNLDEAKSSLLPLLTKIKLSKEDTLQVALSNVRIGVHNLNKSYDECKKILEYRFLLRSQVILTMEQVKETNKKTYYYPLKLENQLIHYAAQGDSRAIEIYNELIKENRIFESLDLNARRNFVLSLIGTINRVIQELKLTPEEIFQKDIDFWSLSERWNQKEIFNVLRNTLDWICLFVREESEKEDSNLSGDMLHFIHENYQDDIMLVDLSEKMNVSEKYCGILFKKETGENFKSYLNKYRIQQAKAIIFDQSSIKVADLAQKVGFNSSNTFIRVFSKYTGMTPKQYADELRSGK